MIDDFWFTLIVSRTLGHNLRQILVAKIPKGHEGDSNPRTSDLESDTLAPYQQAVINIIRFRVGANFNAFIFFLFIHREFLE